MQLEPGDVITRSVSHQVKVGRDESWSKAEMSYVIKTNDDLTTIEQEITDHVLDEVFDLAMKTSKQMEENK